MTRRTVLRAAERHLAWLGGVQDAEIRGVADISTELSEVKTDMPSTGAGRALQRLAPIAGRAPGCACGGPEAT